MVDRVVREAMSLKVPEDPRDQGCVILCCKSDAITATRSRQASEVAAARPLRNDNPLMANPRFIIQISN